MERSQKEDFRTGHVPKIQTETDKVCCQNSREENHQERKKKNNNPPTAYSRVPTVAERK